MRTMLLVLAVVSALACPAQTEIPQERRMRPQRNVQPPADSTALAAPGRPLAGDTAVTVPTADSLAVTADSLPARKKGRDWATWKPDVKRALWLSLVLPGAGQAYNRKYWKLPIIYGGFVGCIYALRWNNMMYHDYAQAYIDIMDSDPETQSYNEFLHLGNTVDESNLAQYQEIFRKRKDRYRRWRDMSVFALIAVYALSVIDAYVDASLSQFDISPDLSFHVAPAVISPTPYHNAYALRNSGLGVQCSLNF